MAGAERQLHVPPPPNPTTALLALSPPPAPQVKSESLPPPPPPPPSDGGFGPVLWLQNRWPRVRVTSEYDNDSSKFRHQISSKLFDSLAKVKLSCQNNGKAEISEPQSDLTLHYDVEDLTSALQLKAIPDVKSKQGEVAMVADLAGPAYKLELSSSVPALGTANNGKGEISEPQLDLTSKYLSLHYDVEDQNTSVKANFDLTSALQLKAIGYVKAKQVEVAMVADLVGPAYKLDLSSSVLALGTAQRATFKFSRGEVLLQDKEVEEEEAKKAFSINGILKGHVLNGVCTAQYKDEALDLRYLNKDEQMTLIPQISLPSNAMSFAFKRRFGPSDKLRSRTTALAFKYMDIHTQRPALCLAADSRLVDKEKRTVHNYFKKIMVVSRTVLFVFSGESSIATRIVDFLQTEVQKFGYDNYTIHDAIEQVSAEVLHLQPQHDFDVILAGYDEPKKDYLIAYIDKKGGVCGMKEKFDIVCIGSGGQKAYEFLERHRWRDYTTSPRAVQIASRAICYCASEDEATGGTLTVYISGGYFEGRILHTPFLDMEDLPTYLRENGLPPQRQD